MMDVGNKPMRATAAGVVPSTPQFCCKPSTPLYPAVTMASAMSNKHQPPQILESTDNNSSQLVLYVADTGNNASNYTSSQNQHVNTSNSVSTFQYQQGYIDQQQLQNPPYHGGQNYQHFQSTTTLSSNEFYHQQVRNFNNKKLTNVMSNAATTNSIYNNKINLFQNCYPNYVEDKNEMDPQYSSGAPTGYIATVTAVAGGSPTGNVSSSSYFSSNSSSPSTSCMTPRSTSRCDSARSAESSCSSTDSGVEMSQQLVLHQQQQQQQSSTSYPSPQQPPGNLVFVSLPPTSQCNPPLPVQQVRPTPIPHVSPHTTSAPSHVDISVPLGWRRLLVNNTIVYVSPSGAELCSREALRQYLATAGTCKCGLECPLHLDRIFSFDTKVTNRAWPLTPEPSELTRLCNHKRKPGAPTIQQAALPRSPLHRGLHSDPAKECPSSQAGLQQGVGISPQIRRRRRKAPGPYDGVLVSQLLAQRDRLAQQQPMPGLPVQQPMLGMPGHQAIPIMPGQQAMNMPINGQHPSPSVHPSPSQHQQQYKDLPPPRSWESMHPPPTSISQPQQQQMQQQQIQQQQQQIQQQTFPQLRPPCQPMIGPPPLPPPHQQQQFRQFPVSMANTPVSASMHSDTHKQQQQAAVMYGGQYMELANKAYHDHMAKQQPRGPPPPYMPPYNTNYNYQQGPINNQPIQQNQWNNNSGNMAQYHNACNRDIPPHQLSWDDVSKRKKLKSKKMKLNNSCPNVDVRQMAIESKANQQQMQLQIQPPAPQQSHNQQHMQNHPQQQTSFLQPEANNGIPSFMEDPNGFLAQQTALLNSTILRQTGANISNQRATPSLETSPTITSSSSSSPPSSVFPLPSNVSLSKTVVRSSTPQSTVSYSQAHPMSSNYSNQPSSLPDSASECQACSINNAAAAALAYQQASNKETAIPPDENPVTSSTILQDKASPNPDPRGPIQGGTISTSEISSNKSDTDALPSPSSTHHPDGVHYEKCPCVQVTTMASGHTVSSNTITSVQAGRANTVTVTVSNFSPHSSSVNTSPTFPVSVTKSPLEMVQSVVSSIQVPPSPIPQTLPPISVTPQQPLKIESNNQIIDHHQLLKTGLPPGHFLVSSNGQLIMTSQPQKLLNATNQPSVPVSSAANSMSHMIPTMNMGQPMVQLVNTLPCNGPLLLQSGMMPQTVTVEGMGSPLHLTLSGNVLHQGQLTPDDRTIITNTDLLGNNMGHKKKGKKRKSPHQTVASMLQLQNPPVIMQNFHTIPTQQQGPLLQTVTILPNNKHQFLQFPANTSPQANGSQTSPQQQAQQQFGHLLTSHQNSINLIQPLNLLNNTGGFVPNFPLQQILQGGTTLVVPSLQGLQGMVSLPDGTLVSPEHGSTTVQLQLQNVNGQQVLTSVPSQNMFGGQQNLGMVIRTPGPQTQMISNKIATTGQVISQNGQLISPQSQFLVNGAFTQQTALNGLMMNTGQQVTLAPQNTSPPGTQNQTLRGHIHGDFIQCMNLNGQSMIIPCSSSQQTVPTTQSQQNAGTLLQQNTTIVQQQTTLVANNQNTAGANTIINPNFILNSNILSKPFPDLTAPLLLQKHSVSTQTAGAQTQTTIIPSSCLGVASTPTCHTVTVAVNSPPVTITQPADTTTSSPVAAEPATSSTADGVSSSEPDPETLAWASRAIAAFTASEEEVESSTKQSAQLCEDKRAGIAGCKRKHSDLLVIESRPTATQEVDDTAAETTGPRNLSVGDVVWGPARGFPSWPGKLVSAEDDSNDATKVEAAPSSPPSTSFQTVSTKPPLKSHQGKVWVRWFGDVTSPTQVDLCLLKTLSEGLEAHHRATKKFRKGRKMNSQLENAIQEAMLDLDHMTSKQNVVQGTNNSNEATPTITTRINKKVR